MFRKWASRNHPKEQARRRARQAQLDAMELTDDMLARHTAARAFLYGEWFGACLIVASFTLLYLFAAVQGPSVGVTLGVCMILLSLGTFIFWRNHSYYKRLEYPWAQRWDAAAVVVAGSGGIFWLLFVLLEILTLLGIPIQ